MLQKLPRAEGLVSAILVITVRPEDAGMWSCDAYNDLGRDSLNKSLVVHCESLNHSLTMIAVCRF